MAHELHRLSASIYNQPLLVSKDQLGVIEDYLQLRNDGLIEAALDKSKRPLPREDLVIDNGVGVVKVQGAITAKANELFESLCGMVSYETVLREINALAARDDVHTVLLDVDSGGGEALNMVSTSLEIRKVVQESGKRLIGFANGTAASAAYGLISAADEIVMTSDSQVGSIGVLLALKNANKAELDAGISTTYVTAGASKIPYDKETMEFREDFIADLQERVDEMYGKFTGLVAKQRSIPLGAVKGTEARMYSADKALELGLVDKVMEPTEFYEYLSTLNAQVAGDEEENKPVAKATNTIQKETPLMSDVNITAEQLAEMQTALANLQAESAAKDEQLASFLAKEQASAVEAMTAKMDAIPFVAAMENKGSLVDFLMSANEEQSALMNSVIDAANLENAKVLEEAASQMAEKEIELNAAKEEAAEAKAEAEAVKAEFGTQDSIEGDVEGKDVAASATSGSARTAALAAKVKAKLANK